MSDEKQHWNAYWHLYEARKHIDAALAMKWRIDEMDDIRIARIRDAARQIMEACGE